MNWVRRLREYAGITQGTLAERAGTSQPTIASYESGTKSPTLSTLQRLAASAGLEMSVSFAPRLTREDRRSLAYHKALIDALRSDPVISIQKAKRNLARMISEHPGAIALLERWKIWLELPMDELTLRMLDIGTHARDMRQVSPFAGVLPPEARLKVLKEFREAQTE